MRSAVALVCLIVLVAQARGQTWNPDEALVRARNRSKNSIVFPFSLLVPDGIREGYDMRDYIASPEFGIFDSSNAAEAVFDEIYYTAEVYAHGDPSNSLLSAAFGVIEHEYLPIAFFGSEIRIPLTSENHARFALRCSHLPAHIYHTAEGDRDKLQHFFASAWLKEALGMDWLARLAGTLVEVGEDLFLVGGVEDPRDLHANHDGIRFARHTEGNMDDPPEQSLTPNP